MIDSISQMERKAREIFLSLGFSLFSNNPVNVYEYHGRYYKFTYLHGLNGFVIESASCIEEAVMNVYEDDEIIRYPLEEKHFLSELVDVLKKYHMW